MYIQRICRNKNCSNPVFKQQDRCALHCKKGRYADDKHSGLLEEFYNLLKKYIISQKAYGQLGIVNIQSSDDDKLSAISTNNYLHGEIHFKNIYFPESGRDFNYKFLINIFEKINFIDCHIYSDKMSNEFKTINTQQNKIKSKRIFFDSCIFYNKFIIYPFEYLENDTKSMFLDCIFRGKIEIRKSEEFLSFDYDIFCGAVFCREIFIHDIAINGKIFNQEQENKIIIKDNFKIEHCTFGKKITLNNLIIKNLTILDSVFQNKLEIKDGKISDFQFLNSNVEKVFTAFNTKFKQFKMEESIFEDFAGFEKAEFGEENNVSALYVSNFIYVTFKSFSNFRESKFFSGLDLSRINLKEQPNFLDTFIEPTNTNRETFRIIKNSFDKNGSHIEANRYFSQEMIAYKKQLKSDKEFQGKEYRWTKFVVYINDFISNFGDSYIRPVVILIASLIIYSSIVCINQCFIKHGYYLKSSLYEISNLLNQLAINFLPFTKFLEKNQGLEFISLLFYIWFLILVWQIFIAVKRKVIRE